MFGRKEHEESKAYLIQIPESWDWEKLRAFLNMVFAKVQWPLTHYPFGRVVTLPGESLPEGFEDAFVPQ